MPRNPRHFEPDTLYHVTDRGVERRAIFRNDEDRTCFMQVLLGSLRDAACSLLAYCLMDNHFHLLVGVAQQALGIPLHRALTSHSVRFNALNARSGHLFESRYFSRPVYDSSYLHNVVAYIHRNPVEAAMVRTVDQWPWSSHADWATLSNHTLDFQRVEALCGMSVKEVRDEYLRRVAFMADPTPKGLSVEELMRDTALMMGLDPEAVRRGERGTVYTEAKRTLLRRAALEGHPDIEIARALGCTPSAIAHLKRRSPLPPGSC